MSLALKNHLWLGCAGLLMSSWRSHVFLEMASPKLEEAGGQHLVWLFVWNGHHAGEIKYVLFFQLAVCSCGKMLRKMP